MSNSTDDNPFPNVNPEYINAVAGLLSAARGTAAEDHVVKVVERLCYPTTTVVASA